VNTTCRDEILNAIDAIVRRTANDIFELRDVLTEMRRRESSYNESTIRTHITSRMCANAPTTTQSCTKIWYASATPVTGWHVSGRQTGRTRGNPGQPWTERPKRVR
jgi:hypothetical protein